MLITKEKLLSALYIPGFTILDANILKETGDDFNKEVTYEAWFIEDHQSACILGIQNISYEKKIFAFKRLKDESFHKVDLLKELEERSGHIEDEWKGMNQEARDNWCYIIDFDESEIDEYELPESSILYKMFKAKLKKNTEDKNQVEQDDQDYKNRNNFRLIADTSPIIILSPNREVIRLKPIIGRGAVVIYKVVSGMRHSGFLSLLDNIKTTNPNIYKVTGIFANQKIVRLNDIDYCYLICNVSENEAQGLIEETSIGIGLIIGADLIPKVYDSY